MKCGTRAGYLTHHRRGEKPCDRCLEAMRPIWKAADRKRQRPRHELEAPCGTYAAYRRHLRRREPVDEACRLANNQTLREYKATVRRRRRRGSISDVLLDWVETHQPIDTQALTERVLERHPDMNPDAIRRTLWRMAHKDQVVNAGDRDRAVWRIP